MSNIQIVRQQIDLAKVDFENNVQSMSLDLNFQKEAAFALQIFQGNDYLTKMEPNSIRDAIINVSLTGLTLNPVMKMAYLVPRKGKCILDVSYMGLIKIVTDTGSVKNIEAKIVYSNEPFEIQQGSGAYVKHGIAPTPDKGVMIGVYSKAILNDGSTSVEWMYKADVDAIMMRSESVKSGGISPWKSDYDQMARKTVIKRHYKFLPKTERGILASNAIELDHQNNDIDFKQNKVNTKTVSIDTLDPSNEDDIKSFKEFEDIVLDERMPEVIKSGDKEMNVESGYNKVLEMFNSGSLHKAALGKYKDFYKAELEKVSTEEQSPFE
jgi:phage RecT family recombinase